MNLKSITVCCKSFKITPILIVFSDGCNVQFGSHKSRSFIRNHFSNMWVCFLLILLDTFRCNFYTNFSVIFYTIFYVFLCRVSFTFYRYVIICYLDFQFIVNKLHIFNCKKSQFICLIFE